MMGIGPVPEQQEDGGLIECYHRSEPAELPGILDKGEKNTNEENKRLFKKTKTKEDRGRRLRFYFVWVCCSVTICWGARSEETRRTLKLSINDTIQGEQTCG